MVILSTQRQNWGDTEEEDGDDLDFPLPPPIVIGPDENGIKKVISSLHEYNSEGSKVMVTTTTTSRVTRTRKEVVERRSWPKFGAAAVDGNEGYTKQSTEEISIERPTAPGGQLMLCRTCNGDHRTAWCPWDSGNTENEVYVAPRPDIIKRRDDNKNSIRVSNFSEDTLDRDLFELFCVFGTVSGARVVYDRQTGESRGFGFVDFVNKEDGQKAIDKLNGYGYANLILHVEWAPKKKNNQ
ncbi:hypothetical protein MKW94_006831 [Papaver nudicaule]|uniref:RRM domain-containing protein n=1 Tax=Papaver nudicaule TaxID=74823 RepID=A0AA41S7N6_PAPNU|nr:hypothetical protein [Papaver nudicaule]